MSQPSLWDQPQDRSQSRLADAVPPYAPHSETSKDTAIAMVKPAARLRRAVLDVLRARPEGLTADEIAAELCKSVLSIRPRVTELKSKNYGALLVETGRRRPNVSGHPAAVVRLREAS